MPVKNTLNTRNGTNGIELFDDAGVVHYPISYDRNNPNAWIVNVVGRGPHCSWSITGQEFYSSRAAEYACLAHFLESQTQRDLRVLAIMQ